MDEIVQQQGDLKTRAMYWLIGAMIGGMLAVYLKFSISLLLWGIIIAIIGGIWVYLRYKGRPEMNPIVEVILFMAIYAAMLTYIGGF